MDIGALIPIFALSIPIIAIWTTHQRKLAEMGIKSTATESAEKAAQYASGMKELEERVRVLERIVTDKGYDVATQIEALRDQRRVDELIEAREAERSN
ncbi:MAG TPA: hypothetical protein VNR60_10090 [Croceibacterium sp.]|nr:hypothetical protein [Croceibacterium sp.]